MHCVCRRVSPRVAPPRVNEPPAELPSVTGIEINKQALGAISRSVNICSTVSRLVSETGTERERGVEGGGREEKRFRFLRVVDTSPPPHTHTHYGAFLLSTAASLDAYRHLRLERHHPLPPSVDTRGLETRQRRYSGDGGRWWPRRWRREVK